VIAFIDRKLETRLLDGMEVGTYGLAERGALFRACPWPEVYTDTSLPDLFIAELALVNEISNQG
jgi:hypothetical protein